MGERPLSLGRVERRVMAEGELRFPGAVTPGNYRSPQRSIVQLLNGMHKRRQIRRRLRQTSPTSSQG
jgi:hypothetical protein